MESRERVIRTIEFEGPDRVPVSYDGIYEAAFKRYGQSLKEILARYPDDFSKSGFSATGTQWREISENGARMRKFMDDWGCVWGEIHEGIWGQAVEHPVRDWKLWDEYKFPEPPSWQKISERDQSKYVIGAHKFLGLFERMQQLRGFQNLLVDLVTDRREVRVLLDRILKYDLEVIQQILETGVDAISVSDDWGTQKGLMINPKAWRELFKPAYEKMFRKAKAAGRHVFYHSDGYVKEIIPDLISCGMDVFYPQFGVADIDEWEQTCGGKVCIIASIDVQNILPRGSVEEVKRYAQKMMETLGSHEGGLINAPEIAWGIPLANIEAAFEIFWNYGRYPRRIEN